MLLRNVVLENYGLYQNRNEFNLIPDSADHTNEPKPVILFGGKNGAGKTTLLDAVRLTLYGKRSIGTNPSKKEYSKFLEGKIHRSKNPANQKKWARTAIEFDYAINGSSDRYYIERLWRKSEAELEEKVTILKNQKEIDEVEVKNWEAFAASIVPERLSQLFFFDGEKIKMMAEDTNNNLAFKEAVRSLLGLDLVDRLKADMSIYLAREAKKTSAKEDIKEIERIEGEIQDLKNTIEQQNIQILDHKSLIDDLNEQALELENKLQVAGGEYAELRASEKESENLAKNKVEIISKEIRMIAEGSYPISLCPNITNKLREQVKLEQEKIEHGIACDQIRDFSQELKEILQHTSLTFDEDAIAINEMINTATDRKTKISKRIESCAVIHNFSSTISAKMEHWIKEARKAQTKIKNLSQELEDNLRRQHKASQTIAKAPDNDAIKPIIADLNELNIQIGKYESQVLAAEEIIRISGNKVSELERTHSQIISNELEQSGIIQRANTTEKIKNALDKYQLKILCLKLSELEKTVSECFNNLLRKKDFSYNFSINPETFDVQIITAENKPIPKKDLSSGEKQIYAIALLWGLAKTSGRSLPVIIDTPLGRLDGDHRINIVQNYFPYAGHQVIILSTDTEIDAKLHKEISPFVTRSYHLAYNQDEKFTEVKDEYFWSKNNG